MSSGYTSLKTRPVQTALKQPRETKPLLGWFHAILSHPTSDAPTSCTSVFLIRFEEVENTLFFPSHKKFHTVVLKGVRTISDALQTSPEISRVSLIHSIFHLLNSLAAGQVDEEEAGGFLVLALQPRHGEREQAVRAGASVVQQVCAPAARFGCYRVLSWCVIWLGFGVGDSQITRTKMDCICTGISSRQRIL